jgi:uncharacterized protein YnzC (UPF0291/DUF896 family)
MSITFDTTALDRATDPILRLLTREQVETLIAYRGEPEIRERIDELASKHTEGELTEAEQAEYEGYLRANNFIAILQSKARRMVSTVSSKAASLE